MRVKSVIMMQAVLLSSFLMSPVTFASDQSISESVVVNFDFYAMIRLTLPPDGDLIQTADLNFPDGDGIDEYGITIGEDATGNTQSITYDIFSTMHKKSGAVRTDFILTIYSNGDLDVLCPVSLQLKKSGVLKFFDVSVDVWYNGVLAVQVGKKLKFSHYRHLSPSGSLILQFSPGTLDDIWDLTQIPEGTYSSPFTFTITPK